MFGGPKASTTPPPSWGRPQTSDVAKMNTHLTHVIVSNEDLDGLHVFHDGQPILTGKIENIGVEIVAPDDTSDGNITGVLTYYDTDKDGERQVRSISLFPGTVELLAKGRRVVIHCTEANSFDGLYLSFGMAEDGMGLQAEGVKSVRIVVAPKLLDARLIWVEDNREDNIFP
ncbi:MAG: hypothetical protein OHK0029_11600 [Armatimonadaceae bacterium]